MHTLAGSTQVVACFYASGVFVTLTDYFRQTVRVLCTSLVDARATTNTDTGACLGWKKRVTNDTFIVDGFIVFSNAVGDPVRSLCTTQDVLLRCGEWPAECMPSIPNCLPLVIATQPRKAFVAGGADTCPENSV